MTLSELLGRMVGGYGTDIGIQELVKRFEEVCK